MPAHSIPSENVSAIEESAEADSRIVNRLRLVLAAAALCSAVIDPALVGFSAAALPLLGMYFIGSVFLCACAEVGAPLVRARIWPWLDLGCLVLMLMAAGSAASLYVVFFIFIILSGALRRGFDEGARLSLGAAVGLLLVAADDHGPGRAAGVLLGLMLVLSIGYLLSQLGEQRLQARRRAALLHALAHCANPRLGLGHTVTAMLERTRAFFGAERCVLLLAGHGNGPATLRTVEAGAPLAVPEQKIDATLAGILAAVPAGQTVAYRRRVLSLPLRRCPEARGDWLRADDASCARAAELLGADNFISVPVHLAHAAGRVFVARCGGAFTRADALFLTQVVDQAVPVAENLALLDRIAASAASDERKRFALNLHDTAVQPYIGLSLGLAALRRKAGPDNPLTPDLDALAGMAQQTIAGLRAYAGSVAQRTDDATFCMAALARLSAQVQQQWGLQVLLDVPPRVALGGRLTAEVVQIVREGLNNIARHTAARQGVVRLRRREHVLQIQIDNEHAEAAPASFMPRSISERAAVLGGRVYVRRADQGTAVCVEIPL